MGDVNNKSVMVLVDSRSTHNFVQEVVAPRLGYGIQPMLEFHVFIGRGEYLLCRELRWKVAINIQGVTLVDNLFVFLVEGANLILGVHWLETLEFVIAYYKKLTLEFNHEGARVML